MTDAPRMALRADAPPARVAARLRAHLETVGWRLLPDAVATPPDGLELVLSRGGRATWIHPDPPEGTPDKLAALLSQALRVPVTGALAHGDVCAYERCEGGRVVEKLAARGSEVLEALDSPHEAAVRAGEPLAAALVAAGFDGLGATAAEVRRGRAIVLRFGAPGRKDVDAIEIDPGLSCPSCGQPMARRQGRHGAFWGCVRFPDCRGQLSDKRAAAQREGG